jgi:hypothetical protein
MEEMNYLKNFPKNEFGNMTLLSKLFLSSEHSLHFMLPTSTKIISKRCYEDFVMAVAVLDDSTSIQAPTNDGTQD